MKTNKLKERLDFEINKRMDSRNWDLDIASKVIQSKNRSRKKAIYISSISSFSFAALMIIFFIFGLTTTRLHENLYEQFITKQIEGTYTTVTGKDAKNLVAGNNSDLIFTGEIDTIIDETLNMR